MEKIIVGGRIIDPAHNRDEIADIVVVGGRIAQVGSELPREGREIINAENCLVFPGLIDLHVHLREPGQTQKETISTGTRAAAAGGFTTVCAMPNTTPVVDNGALVEYVGLKAAKEGVVNVLPICAITRGSEGEELVELGTLQQLGAVACSDDGRGVMNSNVMRRALEYAAMLGMPLINHCEDRHLAQDGVANEGYPTINLGLQGIPAAAEEVMVARDLALAAATGCPIHLAHISTAGSVALIKEAKARGVPVTAEVTPHHLTLTETLVDGYFTNAKVNPPLRTAADVTALRLGLADGTIDIIATDHAPHSQGEKAGTFGEAPFGISGLETALGVILTELVAPGIISLQQAVAALTIKPAQILNINRGTLGEGAAADLTIVDPNYTWAVDPSDFYSMGHNTPWAGRTLQGKPLYTLVKGRVVYREGKILV